MVNYTQYRYKDLCLYSCGSKESYLLLIHYTAVDTHHRSYIWQFFHLQVASTGCAAVTTSAHIVGIIFQFLFFIPSVRFTIIYFNTCMLHYIHAFLSAFHHVGFYIYYIKNIISTSFSNFSVLTGFILSSYAGNLILYHSNSNLNIMTSFDKTFFLGGSLQS